jgi:hypothetical protein
MRCRKRVAARRKKATVRPVAFEDSGHGLTTSVMVILVVTLTCLRGAHNNDRAPGVVDTLLTDGAEQEATEPAMPARPNH